MRSEKGKRYVRDEELAPFLNINRYLPLDAEPNKRPDGRPPLAEARRWMRASLRSRQNTIADFLDFQEEVYDWDGELKNRWMPKTHSKKAINYYDPREEYKGRNHGSVE